MNDFLGALPKAWALKSGGGSALPVPSDFAVQPGPDLSPVAAAGPGAMPTPTPTVTDYTAGWSTKSGFKAAAVLGGVTAALPTCLIKLYRDYHGEEDPRRHEYESRIVVLRERDATLEAELPGLRSHEQEDSPRIKELRNLQTELQREADNPKPTDLDGYDAFTLGVSALLFVFLIVYLFVFYTSAGYSAFFKNIGAEIAGGSQSSRIEALFSSIFDASALRQAGKTGNLFVLFFPAIFLSLGFVIHKLHEFRQHAASVTFVLIALVFDCLLAYQISAKLFQAAVLTGLATGEFSMRLAVMDVNFWSVILAGFVVYLVWTFVLGFLMREMRGRASRRRTVHERRRRIEDVQAEIRQHQARREDEIRRKERELQDNRVEIARLQTQADGRVVRWPIVEDRIETFVRGWLDYVIGVTDSPAEQKAKVEEVRAAVDAYKADILRGFGVGGGVVVLKDVRLS